MGRLSGVIKANVTGIGFDPNAAVGQTYAYDGFDNLTEQLQNNGTNPSSKTDTSYDSLNRATTVKSSSGSTLLTQTTPTYLGASMTVASEAITVGTNPGTKTYAYAPDGERLTLFDSATSKTAYYTYNEHGDVEALTDTTGATLATYGYTAYGANDATLGSGLDANPSPGAFPFNTYRFRAGRVDPTTGNLAMGYGTYDPNMNGFISRAGITGDPRSAIAPSRPLTWGEALSFAGDFFLNLGWIQQSFHTDFQTNASAGDKAWAAVGLLGAVGLDVLQFTPEGWLSDAAKAVRLAKGADEAITAASDAEKAVAAADEAANVVREDRILYRGLGPEEDPSLGLSPRNPANQVDPQYHVGQGSRAGYPGDQFISLSKSQAKAGHFSSRVVVIDMSKVSGTVIDVSTDEGRLAAGISPRSNAWYYAKKWEEVLLEDGYIPPDAITPASLWGH